MVDSKKEIRQWAKLIREYGNHILQYNNRGDMEMVEFCTNITQGLSLRIASLAKQKESEND